MGRFAPFALGSLLALLAGPARAQGPLEVLAAQSGDLTPVIVQLISIVTILAILPSIMIMVTSFTKFVVVFSVLRSALGLQQSPPNIVIIGLALFLTLFVMQPTLDRAWQGGVEPYLAGTTEVTTAFTATLDPFRDFMMANVRDKDLLLFEELAAKQLPPSDQAAVVEPALEPEAPGADTEAAVEPALTTLIPAFMTSELRKAFTIAFLLFVPFLVIEMIVSSVLMAMGMMMLPPVVISLPFKLIFFVLVDGWWLIAGSLARSYS